MTATDPRRAALATLASLAELDAEAARVRGRLQSLAEEFQSNRMSVRTSMSAAELARQRLVAQHQRPATDDQALGRLTDSLHACESEHARLLAAFEAGLPEIERRRAKIEKEGAAIDARRSVLLGDLPSALARSYQSLNARRVPDPVAGLTGDSCGACGAAIHDASDAATLECNQCGRLLIPATLVQEPTASH
jgi:hypothetical protein